MTAYCTEIHPALLDEEFDSSGWRAQLNLSYRRRPQGNVLISNLHTGPLRVQRCFYPEGGEVPHTYILHPPGGLVAGDHLVMKVQVEKGSHALISTPSAGRVYRSNQACQRQSQVVNCSLQENAVLEWLPQENIVFDGANAHNVTAFELADTARLIAWDIICLGRPAGDKPFVRGELTQRLQVNRSAIPLFYERMHLKAGHSLQQEPWGLQGKTVIATMVATVVDEPLVRRLKNTLQYRDERYQLAFTQRRDLLIGRYLGDSAMQARDLLTLAWHEIRPVMLERPVCIPRIWMT